MRQRARVHANPTNELLWEDPFCASLCSDLVPDWRDSEGDSSIFAAKGCWSLPWDLLDVLGYLFFRNFLRVELLFSEIPLRTSLRDSDGQPGQDPMDVSGCNAGLGLSWTFGLGVSGRLKTSEKDVGRDRGSK